MDLKRYQACILNSLIPNKNLRKYGELLLNDFISSDCSGSIASDGFKYVMYGEFILNELFSYKKTASVYNVFYKECPFYLWRRYHGYALIAGNVFSWMK